MSRTDEDLYTGITSISSGRKPTQEKIERKQAKEEKRIKLKPAAQVVLAELQQEIDRIRDISSFYMNELSSEVDIKSELLARQRYTKFLSKMYTNIERLTKDPEVENE